MISIIKLGGSLLQTDQLHHCLDQIDKGSGIRIIVPGGGVFADLIREQQSLLHFNDQAAHEMAILAMHQYAIFLHSIAPSKWTYLDNLDLEIKHNQVYIWRPNLYELTQHEIAATWSITSDSLAAWLCHYLNAKKLLVIKSTPVDSSFDLTQLVHCGIVDESFLDYTNILTCPIHVIHHNQLQHFL